MRIGKAAVLSILLASMVSLAHCAAGGRQQAQSTEGEYRKLVEAQKARMEAVDKGVELKDLPKMGAEDYDRLGDRYLGQGNMMLAFIEYQKALKLRPGLVRTRYKVGRLFLRRGLTDDALRSFETIEKQDPRSPLASLGKGLTYFRRGDVNTAEEQLDRALALDPALWQAHALLGLVYDHEKRFDKAEEHYRKGLLINPRSVILYNDLGISYYLKGDYVACAKACLKAVELDPSNRKVYNNLGLALSKMGKYREALAAFKRGNDEAGAYNNMGYIYMGDHRYKEAEEALEKAIELDPQFYARAHENLERAKEASQ